MSTALAFTLLVCRKSRAWLYSCKPDHFECLILKVIYFLSLCTRLVGSELDDYPQTTHRRRRFNRPWLSSCWVSTVHMEMSETQAKTVKSARRNNLQFNRLLGIHRLYGFILLPYWSSFLWWVSTTKGRKVIPRPSPLQPRPLRIWDRFTYARAPLWRIAELVRGSGEDVFTSEDK